MAQLESNHALLEPHELAEAGPSITRDLPLELVDENPLNPRKALTEIEDLAESIKEFGLLQPIAVRRAGDRYELLAGHRRRLAFLLLREREPFEPKWRTIDAVLRTFDDEAAYLALLASQLQSKAWQPREEAAALEALASTRTLPQVGALVHKSAVWVSHRLRVYNDSVLSGFVQTGRLSMSVADELRLVQDPAVRRELADRAVTEQWERGTARAEVRKLKTSRMVAQIGRLARDLLEALALVQPAQLPPETTATLWKVRGRITALGRGAPVMPTIEQAEKVARVNPERPAKATRGRRKPGYKPRTG
jgi:ParB/RepB/Spo0J family partition protein